MTRLRGRKRLNKIGQERLEDTETISDLMEEIEVAKLLQQLEQKDQQLEQKDLELAEYREEIKGLKQERKQQAREHKEELKRRQGAFETEQIRLQETFRVKMQAERQKLSGRKTLLIGVLVGYALVFAFVVFVWVGYLYGTFTPSDQLLWTLTAGTIITLAGPSVTGAIVAWHFPSNEKLQGQDEEQSPPNLPDDHTNIESLTTLPD